MAVNARAGGRPSRRSKKRGSPENGTFSALQMVSLVRDAWCVTFSEEPSVWALGDDLRVPLPSMPRVSLLGPIYVNVLGYELPAVPLGGLIF